MKFLVYGHQGWIGRQFINLLEENTYILGNYRADDNFAVEKEIKEYNPTHVIALIGRTHGKIGNKVYPTIDYLEQPGKLHENIRDNLYAPLILAIICTKLNIHFTYLGTGCIFSSTSDFPTFDENSLPNFTGSSYSIVKGFTDQLMHQFSVLNLRIRMPITGEDNPRNFITKITTYDKICSIPNSMTVLPELLPIALRMIIAGKTGTVNLTNPGCISHNQILELYRKYVDSSFTWKNFTLEEQQKILESERSNNQLSTKVLQDFEPKVLPIYNAVEKVLQNYKPQLPKIKKDIKPVVLLVTGGCGFIGSYFINTIYDRYSKIHIINIDAMYYCADITNIREDIRSNQLTDKRYTLVEGNLQSFELVAHIFKTNTITHVVHFAAQSHVQNSFTDALQYTQDNIVGTHNLLEVCRQYGEGIQKIIHVSTDEVYGQSSLTDGHKTEQSILCPTNPYAATKAAAEMLVSSYISSFNLPIVITRGNNVYGPRQYPEKLIPRFIQQLKDDKQVTIQGDGSCVRAFLHVSDVCEAFVILLERGSNGEIYNIGSDGGEEYSVLEIAKILIGKLKPKEDYRKWIKYVEDRPFNDKRYYISNQKLKKLGWKIGMGFDAGLDLLI